MSDLSADPTGNANRDARERLRGYLKEHGQRIHQLIEQMIPRKWRSVLSADDVMQQTYTDIFMYFEREEPNSIAAPAAWIMEIAQNNLKDALRMLEAEKRGGDRLKIQASLDDSYLALFETLTAGDTTPSRRAARGEMRAKLELAIRELPEIYAQVVRMFDLEGRTMEETALAIGRGRGAGYMIRARAHRRLGQLMGALADYFNSSR